MSSQPQLYEFVREGHIPELFEKIREKIQEGRWEAEGGCGWSGLQSASGESPIRHILYGKRF